MVHQETEPSTIKFTTMADPTEPLEDVLVDNWDSDTSIASEGKGEAEVQRKDEEPQSPGKPNIETEYVMGIGGKPPKVHLSEKLEVVYSRSLGVFDTLNVETTATFDSQEDTITSLESHYSYDAETADSATIATVLSADQQLVRVEDNVMNLLSKMECAQIDSVSDKVANMEEGWMTNLKNVEHSLKERKLINGCGSFTDVGDDHDELFSDEDSATLNSMGSPFSGSDTGRSASSRSASEAESVHSNSSDARDDDSAEVEALVEELDVNGIYPKATPPRVFVPPALIVTPPSNKQSEHNHEISSFSKVESSSSPDKRRGSAWFKKLTPTRSFTPPPGKRSSNPSSFYSPAKKQDRSPKSSVAWSTANGNVVTPIGTNSARLKKGTLPKLKPSPKETTCTRESRKSSSSQVHGIQAKTSASAGVAAAVAASMREAITNNEVDEPTKTTATRDPPAASQEEEEVVGSPTHVDTLVTNQSDGTAEPSVGQNGTNDPTPKVVDASVDDRNGSKTPKIIRCPAMTRAANASLDSQRDDTHDDSETHAPTKEVNLALTQIDSVDSTVADEEELKSKPSTALVASKSTTGTLLPKEKAPQAVSETNNVKSNHIESDDRTVLPGIEYPLNMMDTENKSTGDERNTLSEVCKAGQNSVPSQNENIATGAADPAVDNVPERTLVKELVKKWEKTIPEATHEEGIEIDDLPGIEYSFSSLEQDTVTVTVATCNVVGMTKIVPKALSEDKIVNVATTFDVVSIDNIKEAPIAKSSDLVNDAQLAPAVDDSVDDPMDLKFGEFADAEELDEGFEYTLDSVENDRANASALSFAKSGDSPSNTRECIEEVGVPVDAEAGIEYTLGKHEQFARPNQDAKKLDAPIAVDGKQNDSETDDEAEAEDKTSPVVVSSEHEAVSRSPSRKRLPGRNILARTPKRISSMWKKGQKKDTIVIQSEAPVEEDVISTAEDTYDVSILEISDESESVYQSKDIGTKTTEESVKSVPDDGTLSVDEDTSKNQQFARSNQDAKTLDAPVAVDGKQNDSETDEEAEAEENTPHVAVSSGDEAVSRSPYRKRLPGRNILARTPKRISSMWKKGQKKDTVVIQSEDPVEEDVISTAEDTDDVSNLEISDESESVQSKDIGTKTTEESVKSVPDDGTLSVDEDTSKNQQFARSNQDTKKLDAPIAVDGKQNDSETDEEAEAEENTPPVAISSGDEAVSKSPSRKRLPGRNILARTPKRISPIWKKGQKKDTAVIHSEDPVEEDVISTAEDTYDVSNLEISDESESVQSKYIETKTTEESVKSVPDDGTLSVDEDTSKNQQFARSNQDAKKLDAPIAVEGKQNDSETDEEAEAEDNTPPIAVSSGEEAVSRSPSRKRLHGRNILARTPKRISSIWKKGQKKDTVVIQSEDPVEEDVISTAEDTDDVSNLEISDESESVQSKDIGTKTTEESVKSVPDDGTLSVDKDTSKKHQPGPESPSSVIDIILGMTEMELLASASQDVSSDRSSRAVESGQPKPFVFGASTDDCGVVTASTQDESAPETKKASETAPISPPKIRSSLFPFRKRSNNTKILEDTIVEESEETSEKDNDGAKILEDEAAMLVDKAAALLKKRSSESLLSEQAISQSTLNGMVEENSNSVMDVILEKSHKTATEPPRPDRPVADVKISVLRQSGPMVSTDREKFDERTFEETEKVIDISTGPLPWMQIVPDEGTVDHGDGELEESSIDHGEGEAEAGEENKDKATKRNKRKKYLWKRRKTKPTESRVEPVVAETNEKEEGLAVPKDDISDGESFAPKSTNEDNDEAYTGPMPWEAVANEAAEAAISASEWVGSALGIIDGEETPLPNIADKDFVATERDEEKPKANKGRLFHIRSFGRIASSSSAAKGLPSEESIPLEDGIKRSTSRSFPRSPVEITRTTGSSATQKRDNRGLERIFTVRRNRSKDSAPSDTSVDGSMEPLLIDDEEEHDAAKIKRKKTKIKLHRKRYTNLEDDESKKQVEDESPERQIVTPPNCYDCSSCLKGASSS